MVVDDTSGIDATVFRAAAEASRTPTCITDGRVGAPGGARIVYVNEAYAQLVAGLRADLIGRSPRFMVGPLTARDDLVRLRRRLDGGLGAEGENVYYRLDGRPMLLHWRIEPVQSDGRIAAIVGWLQDVTVQRRGELVLSATVAIDTAVQHALRQPQGPAPDVHRLIRVGMAALRRIVGDSGHVELSVTTDDPLIRWPPTPAARLDRAGQASAHPPTSHAHPPNTAGGAAHQRTLVSPRQRFSGEVSVTPLDDAHAAFIDEVGIDHVCLRLGGALDALLEFTELRRTAVRLQESHLPAPPPPHRAFEAESRYLPSAQSALIGGDWYDVVDTETGPVFVIGDVMGHDMAAAARMGRLRTVVSVLVDRVPSMAQVLQQADAFCVRESILATCLLVRLGPDHLDIVTAGHPPPVIARGATAELPALDAGPPLGVGAGCRPAPAAVPFGIDELLVLYTDGLVEARGEDIEIGLAALRGHLGRPSDRPLARIVDDLIATRRDPGRSDDLAVLAVRRRPPSSAG